MKYWYTYSGSVYEFDRCLERNWTASTWAESEKKARNNLSYRYKKDRGRTKNAKITLPGKISKYE